VRLNLTFALGLLLLASLLLLRTSGWRCGCSCFAVASNLAFAALACWLLLACVAAAPRRVALLLFLLLLRLT